MQAAHELRTYLVTQSDVTDEVGTRIYPEVLPQSPTLPAVVFRTLTGNSHGHLSGKSCLADAVVQFDCYALTSLAARDAEEEIRKAVDRYEGGNIRGVFAQAPRSGYEKATDGKDAGYYKASRDYLVFYTETV